MIITFCGHREIPNREALIEGILSAIAENAKGKDATFYLGGYGDFDAMALRACLLYKETHPSARVVFVTPYLSEEYLKNRDYRLKNFDDILYPEIEKTPMKFAIAKRNQWMAEKADLVIAYVDYGWGGAAKALRFAIRKGKPFINLGKYSFDS